MKRATRQPLRARGEELAERLRGRKETSTGNVLTAATEDVMNSATKSAKAFTTFQLGKDTKQATLLSFRGVQLFFVLLGVVAAIGNSTALALLHQWAKIQITVLVTLLYKDPSSKWKHTYPPAELWLLALMVTAALCELLRFPSSRVSRTIINSLQLKEKKFMRSPRKYSLRLRLLFLSVILARQLHAMDPAITYDLEARRQDTNGTVYFWGTDRMQYLGETHHVRAGRGRTGVVQRLSEHMCLTEHAEHRDGGRRRYKFGRQSAPDKHVFFVCEHGPQEQMAVLETALINMNSPNGNVKKRRPRGRGRRKRRGQYSRSLRSLRRHSPSSTHSPSLTSGSLFRPPRK